MEPAATFHEIYGYYYTPIHQEPWFIALAVFLGVTLISLIGYWLYKRKLRPLSPWEWALREINKLPVTAYSTRDHYKKFYFTVTTILKTYLEKRYNWDTQDKTDEELATFLQLHGFDANLLEKLKKMLLGAGWVKFANEDALKTQIDEDFETAKLIIKKTIPVKKHGAK